MSQVVYVLFLCSLYLFFMGGFFLLIRAILQKINSSQITVYSLWLIFPLGLLTILGIQWMDVSINMSAKISAFKLPSFTVSNQNTSFSSNNSMSWINLIVMTWLVMSVFKIGQLIFNYFRIKSLLLSSSIKSSNGIYGSDKITAPLAFGVIKAMVFIPVDLKNDENKELLILHEQVHCSRKDPLVRIIYRVILAIFWLHPMIYVINNVMIKDQETSCDELVIKKSNRIVAYSKLLLKLNQSNIYSNQSVGLFCSSSSMLKERIMLISKLKLNKNKTLSYAILSVAILGLAISTTTLAGLAKEKVEQKPIAPTKPIKPVTPPKPPKSIKLVSVEGIEIELLKQVAPYYPRAAATKRLEGFVNLEVLVNANGQIGNIKVIESIPEGIFDKEAIRSVEKYEFAPMSQAVTLHQKIEFKLAPSTEDGYGVTK